MKKIGFVVAVTVLTIVSLLVSASARDIGTLFLETREVYEDCDLASDYDEPRFEGVFEEKYTTGGLFSNAKAYTIAPTYCRNYTHVMVEIKDAGQNYYFEDNEIYGGDDSTVTASVSANEDTAIYTAHFCEVWENYAEECLYWLYEQNYVGSAPHILQ